MVVKQDKITVSKELAEYIISLNTEEFHLLEKNILADGCRDPLTVWETGRGVLTLIDGHNRLKICKKHDIFFNVRKLTFRDIEEVKMWMLDNQMGRRNLTEDKLSYYRGLKYLSLKKRPGGYSNVASKGTSKNTTSGFLARTFKVSESTVKRDAKFAAGLNVVGRSNLELKNKILNGLVSVRKADIQILADARNADLLIIKNEADLFNKAKNIRSEIMDDVEKQIKQINRSSGPQINDFEFPKEPIFLDKGDRLKKIKGLIISAINRAINKKDVGAIKELKKLVDRLASEVFE